MAMDEEQNRRIQANADGIAANVASISALTTEQALTTAAVTALKTTFDTGMISLNDTLKERDRLAREDAAQDRKDNREDPKLAREQARWFWGKAFGIISAVVTLFGTGTAAWYAIDDDKPEHAPVEVAAPVIPAVEVAP